MAFFKRATTALASQQGGASGAPGKVNAVIMGRKTFESIPAKFRPLPGRLNVVLSRSPEAELRASLGIPDDVLIAASLDEALRLVSSPGVTAGGATAQASVPVPALPLSVEHVFVIGGGALYREAVASPRCAHVLLTTVHSQGGSSKAFEEGMDTFFPALHHDHYTLTHSSHPVTEKDVTFAFSLYQHVCPQAPTDAAPQGSPQGPAQGGDGDDDVALKPPPLSATAAAERLLDGLLDGLLPVTSGGGGGARASVRGSLEPPAGELLSGTMRPMVAGAPALTSAGVAMARSMRQHPEMQYLNLIREITGPSGAVRGDRTGTGTKSKFGVQMRFSLRDDEFPLLTTKRVFWRGVAEELLWFINGSTNAKLLQDKGVKIWDGNGSREFLDSRGLSHREEGDLGPVYGFQWRHFGAKYSDMHGDYAGQGVDQLAKLIETIKANPGDRRLLLSAWNPADLDQMALPPCHMFCQFYVAHGELSCQMYQRSADMGLGVPFNVASYALLTRLVAHVCGLGCGELVHTIGDAHVYLNHVEPLREQLCRAPRPFPKLIIKPVKTNGQAAETNKVRDIDGFCFEDFEISNYEPHGAIKMKMAV